MNRWRSAKSFKRSTVKDESVAGLMERARQKENQKRRQANGETTEQMVEMEMRRRGDRLVEKVEVPFRIDPRTGHQYAKRKVSGDFRAICPCRRRTVPGGEEFDLGVSVLVEVKHHEERLPWSAFRPHQILALDEHMMMHGITEVAWFDGVTLRFIRWERFREIGFGPGRSVVWTGQTIELHTPTRGKRVNPNTKEMQL